MTVNKKLGFINLCIPISTTALVFILGWPQIILYSLGYKTSTELLNTSFVIIGITINILISFIIGILIDWGRNKKGYMPKKYYIKLPILLIIIILILFAVSFIDKTCA